MKSAYGQPLLTDAGQVLTNGGWGLIMFCGRGMRGWGKKHRGTFRSRGIFLLHYEARLKREGEG